MAKRIKLTDEQAAVVAHRSGKLLVRAHAGSGKTTTNCAHMKAIIEEEGVAPSRILNTTFSRRGAADIAAKAKKLGVPSGVAYRTLHAVCYSILRDSYRAAEEAGLATRKLHLVAAEWKLDHIIKRELERQSRRLGIARDAKGRPAGLKVRDVKAEIGLAKAYMIGAEAWSTAAGETMPAYAEWATTRERAPINEGPAKLIGAIYAAYEAAKADPYAYDAHKFKKHANDRFITFDDMLYVVAKGILQKAEWVSAYRGIYDWAWVDEVQDNSLPQWILCLHLTETTGNLVATGDDQQSIYAFRGAQPAYMKQHMAREDVRCLELTRNFRSREAIIEVANDLLAHAEDKLTDTPMRAGRADAEGGTVTVRAYDTPRDEAEHVAAEIECLLEDGYAPEEICVLYRTNAQSGPIEMALMQRGIRYRVAGHSFFERALVRTALSYLAVALDETDADAWSRAYCKPLRGLGAAFLKAHPTAATCREALANGDIRKSGWKRGAREVLDALDGVRGALAEGGLAAAMRFILEDVGVREAYRDDDAGDGDVTEADEMAGALIECSAKLDDADALLAYARDMGGLRTNDTEGETAHLPLVTLSTAHGSKGLEWGTIFMVGFNAGIFPHALAIVEEERRLAYVTVTRAKDAAHLSYTRIGIQGHAGGPSPFVGEAARWAAQCADAIPEHDADFEAAEAEGAVA